MDTTLDDFIGGRVQALQPARGYRSGVDAVILAASCPAQPGETVLELGCGVGVASLCLAERVPGVSVAGIELQPAYAELAHRNAQGRDFEVFTGDLAAMPDALKQRQFHHVMCNPPYYDPNARRAAQDAGRETAHTENTPLSVWVDMAAKRLRPRGELTLIQRAERLADVMVALKSNLLGSIQIQPLAPRIGRNAHLILVRAKKDGRGVLRLHSPLILHQGETHTDDRPDYTPVFSGILRHGDALRIGD